jgi:hypothetical protein
VGEIVDLEQSTVYSGTQWAPVTAVCVAEWIQCHPKHFHLLHNNSILLTVMETIVQNSVYASGPWSLQILRPHVRTLKIGLTSCSTCDDGKHAGNEPQLCTQERTASTKLTHLMLWSFTYTSSMSPDSFVKKVGHLQYLTTMSIIFSNLSPLGGGERCLHGFGWEARREETTGKT